MTTVNMTLGDTQLILKVCERHGLLRNQTAYVLATARWETAHTMKPVVEAYWLSEDWRRKNLRYYPWHGRGYVQLTWERNYRHAARELKTPLDENPALALEPAVAAEVLVVGMRDGWFTTHRLDRYITLQKSDFRNARRIVNGMDKAAEIAALAGEYDEALLALGYGVEYTPTAPEISADEFGKGDGVVPGIDKPVGKSTTVWTAIGGFMTTALTALSQMDWKIALPVILVAAGFAAWIIRERAKYSREAAQAKAMSK